MSAKTFVRTATATAAALTALSSQAAVINLIDVGGVTGSAAELGFKAAAAYWGNMFTNNVTINLERQVRSAGRRHHRVHRQHEGRTSASPTGRAGFNATKSGSAIDQSIVLPTLTGGGISGHTVGVMEPETTTPTCRPC